MSMNIYRQIAITSREYHDALMGWARSILTRAGLEGLEVYGQLPTSGQVQPHLVFFPYHIGPEVKVQENAPGISLFSNAPSTELLPPAWQKLGQALSAALGKLFPPHSARPHVGAARPRLRYPRMEELPGALRAWYRDNRQKWCVDSQEGALALPPALRWMQGLPTVTRYLIIAHEPGRGANEATTAAPPAAVPALHVLMAAVQLERKVEVLTPPIPPPLGLESYCQALTEILAREPREMLLSTLAAVQRPARVSLALNPIYDLTNRELIQMMDALKRPMQSSLNLQVRYMVGSHPRFIPAVLVHAHFDSRGARP